MTAGGGRTLGPSSRSPVALLASAMLNAAGEPQPHGKASSDAWLARGARGQGDRG